MKKPLLLAICLVLGILSAPPSKAFGIATIKGTLDSITPTHYVIKAEDQTLYYIRKENIDPAQRKRLKDVDQLVTLTVDLSKIETIQEPPSKPKRPQEKRK
jgi:hypothetical protein